LAVVYIKSLVPVTGTLLNDRYIITAASPVAGYTPYDVKVTLGSHFACFPDTTSTNYSISDIYVHPEYGQVYRTNDLALLKLNTVVLFDMNVLPVCLSTPGVLYTGQVSTVASWINSWNQVEVEPTKLCEPKKVGLPVLENSYCPGKVLASSGCIGVVGVQNVLCKVPIL
jgi:Trypsin